MENDQRPATTNRIDGDVGTAVQTGAVHGDVHFHLGVPAPMPASALDPPRSWDELPELPLAVQALLRAQIRAAQDLPYRLPGARRPSLAAVYVRQDVSSGTDSGPSEPARPLPVLDSQGQLMDVPARPVNRLVVRPPSRTVRAALDDDDHLLVTGGPGQGKSTLSLRLAADIAARWSGDDGTDPLIEPVVPVRLTAGELAARLELPFFEALAESVQAEYGALLPYPIDAGTLSGRVSGCRWLLLVDGLDEVADPRQRDRLVKVLATWASDQLSGHYRIVLTTRPITGAALAPFQGAGAARYELLPFDEEALRHFAANWFNEGHTAERFVRQVHDASLDELVRVPLLATIAAIMFEQYGDRPLPDNRYELYEAYLAYLQSARPIAASPWDGSRELLLEHLGRVRLEGDTSLLAAACDWASTTLPQACTGTGWQDELTTYLTAVGPLVCRAGDIQFLHHSFAEHVAATAHARLLPDRFAPDDEQFARLLHAARPGERGRHARLVLLHYTRLRRDETDALIEYLHAGNAAMQVLAARLIAWHAPASPRVIDAFLATARAWASTTKYPSQMILARVSRAAHHPGLAGWLRDLMHDEAAPWESRIEAGTALAVRLYGPDRHNAVTLLRTVVADETIPVEFRFEAAKALVESGTREREPAVAGLVSVLADGNATALQCRNAAIVLAGLGPHPRAQAIDALAGILDDPVAPVEDMVEAAMGLLEICGDFQERCAELFRGVLARRTASLAGVSDAASGLASLGHDELIEAADALKARLADHRLRHLHPFIARALADLGPQYRLEASEILFASASQPGTNASFRVNIATTLAEFGPEAGRRALALLRAVFADPLAGTNPLLWAADALVGLGPEHHAEAARVLDRVARHPHATAFEHTAALGKLADLGEPHRTAAVRELRADLTDRGTEPDVRVRAGRELFRLGPEFHTESALHLLEIASGPAGPQERVAAWRALRSLGSVLARRASDALLRLMGPEEADAWEACGSEADFYQDDTDDPQAAAAALTAVLQDPARAVRHRVSAAHNLVTLGRRHHAPAIAGFLDLLAEGRIPVEQLPSAAAGFRDVNIDRQAELAGALTARALVSDASAELLCETAEALEILDAPDPRVDAAMRALLTDESVTRPQRAAAAMIVARHDRAELPAAVATIRDARHDSTAGSWTSDVKELVALGGDLTGEVRATMSAPDTAQWLREHCAGLLVELRPDLREDALSELRSQATDEFLTFTWRTEAVLRLAQLDPATVGEAIDFHRSVLDDERETVADRCEAANQLVRLDPSQRDVAVAVLRRLAGNSGSSCAERADAVGWLAGLRLPPVDLVPLARAIVHDPAVSRADQLEAARYLPAGELRDASRSVLADRATAVSNWATVASYWDDWSLANEVETLLRDAMTGVETPWAERVSAVAALGALSPRLVREAVELLEKLPVNGHADRLRNRALAQLQPARWARLIDDARTTLDSEDTPWQRRTEAANVLLDVAPELPATADRARLARLLSDQRVADQVRLRVLRALRRFDEIRAIRDDDRARPASRWVAANFLRGYQREDRERGARVLDAIAADPGSRPALRWRVARDLGQFGARGRALAATRLRDMLADETLPVVVRVDSARALGVLRPDLRNEVLLYLRRLRATPAVAVRIQVFQGIGTQEPREAASALRAMAEDPAIGPVNRLRCAQSLSSVHQEFREAAAVLARELAHDDRVPVHIRADAANGLALLSTLCRAEARELLTELRTSWGKSRHRPNRSQPRSRASAASQSPAPDGS